MQIRSDGTGSPFGIGMPTPGIDGRPTCGGATKLLTPVANGPVTGSSTGVTAAAEAAAVPGTGGAGGGRGLATEVTPLCTVRTTPGGVRRSAAVSWVGPIGGLGGVALFAFAATEKPGAGGVGGVRA
jgi:hypothetical protein